MAAASAAASDGLAPPRGPRLFRADSRVAQLVRLFMLETGTASISGDPLTASLAEAVVHALVRGALDGAAPGKAIDRRIRRVLAAVEASYQARWSIEQLAAIAGMNPFSFLRAFKAQLGVSPYQHVIAFRLARAAEQLRSSESHVLQIALACGFTDPGRFARAFRAHYGRTPRAYRADS